MAEPNLPAKKLKTEDDEYRFFRDFHSEAKNAKTISWLRALVKDEYSNRAVFLRVADANATSPVCFDRATIDLEVIRNKTGIGVVVPISIFFKTGFRIVGDFIHEKAKKIPKDVRKRRALQELLQFLSRDHSVFLERKPENEPLLALRFAQHLMISLVPEKTFVIDSYYQRLKTSLHLCCSVEHPLQGQLGDTSFGVAKGWHGRTDVMITGKDVPMMVIETPQDSDAGSVHSDSSVEVKNSNNFSPGDYSQILAQTMVFSFLQNKLNASGSENSLVPGVGICADKLIIFLYDCKEDVLLQSTQMKLFSSQGEEVLSCRAVVILWLVLNYGIFCTGIPDKYKQYKADFHERLGPDYLQIYMKEVTKPLHTQRKDTRSEIFNFDFENSILDEDLFTLPQSPETSEESILL